MFYLKSNKNDFVAMLEISDGKYVVKKGSTVSAKVSDHFKSCKTVRERRKNAGLSENNRILKEDMVFTSASVAGEFVCGSSCNGPSSWKTENGLTLKEVLEKQNENS